MHVNPEIHLDRGSANRAAGKKCSDNSRGQPLAIMSNLYDLEDFEEPFGALWRRDGPQTDLSVNS